MALTDVAQQYLLMIHALGEEGRPVIGARLAERLGVTPPTVTQTLRRLERAGLVVADGRRGIELTPTGRAAAEEARRRQRLAERWLVELVGLDWAAAHEAARTLGTALTPPVAERLSAILGHPADRPGESVPASPVGDLTPLDGIAPGTVVTVERVADGGAHTFELLGYLDRHGIRPGARLTVVAVEPWAHTLTLRHGEDEVVLGTRAAGQVWVRPLTAEDAARGLEPTECPDEESYVAEVVSVGSPCPAGHQLGDRFGFGQRTPCGMCNEAFLEMYPRLEELRQQATARRGDRLDVACPEHGNVTFRVRTGQMLGKQAGI